MSGGPAKRYKGRTTPYVIMTCIVAASGGGQCSMRLLLPVLLLPFRVAAACTWPSRDSSRKPRGCALQAIQACFA